ncbi:glycoside hydrolase family 130 protein [Acidicapsa acidisoli]|uniref:glycoside hydrolase family 130 protein n=1 Tax=Acidicapsa acidisoli TaxID=1615681 RepID=UPI0021DF591D|nr:glycoside hydrolase family 130 protein [Acidicapsa acidisoli]
MRLRLLLISALAVAIASRGNSQTPPTAPQDWALGPFTRPVDEPILKPRPESVFQDPLRKEPVHWEALHTFNPAAVVRDGKVFVLYRAEDDSGTMQIGMHTSRLGLAESEDGIHFTRRPEPVFYPAEDSQKSREWPGGVEDPRIVEAPDGTYVLTYTQWNRKTYTIGVATSRDLIHWTKHGPALGETGPYANLMYKSSGIVTRPDHGRLIAARIHGKFWMYWGEIQVRVASSPDLIHWTPVEESPGKPMVVLENRPDLFDSGFPEVGTPPVLTRQGILVLYNGKNAELGKNPDPDLGAGAYSVGQALFDVNHPTRLLHRLDQPSLHPEKSYERSGQYAAGTTFGEGLVFFRGQWFLYYGCADSFVAVATAPGGAAVNVPTP